ncbi:porin family protein [Tenacibaculum sp. C7A-26P2]|uniref:porin family protein n=1 Tax=Tenacibaculum sp. C7A-26P2 TaxID=3447504 RepID=UPI003F824887
MKTRQMDGSIIPSFKHVLLLFLVATVCNLSLSAQNKVRVSLSGGLNDNDITYKASNRINTEYQNESGNYFKAGVNFKVYKNISIQTGLTYLNKNYRFRRTESLSSTTTLYETRYFNIPVMVGIQPLANVLKNTKFNFEILGGTYVGWWNSLDRDSSARIFAEYGDNVDLEDTVASISESYNFDTNENHFNRVDYGLQAETRLGYNFYKNLSFFVEYSFMYGLSDNQKNQLRQTSKYYYTTSNYGLGLSYNF